MQIRRSRDETPPTDLAPGQLHVQMAAQPTPRLWVGVPASVDPFEAREITGGLDYSQDEQWTGLYWIDGKKVYEKTYLSSGFHHSAGGAYLPIWPLAIPGFDSVVECHLLWHSIDTHMMGWWVPLFYTDPRIFQSAATYYVDPGSDSIGVSINHGWSLNHIHCILRYTCVDR